MIENMIELYSEMPRVKKIRFVSLLGFHLTIVARSSYIEGGNTAEIAANKLRGYNEMMQTCMKQLLFLQGEPLKAYPDKEFFLLLDRHAMRSTTQPEMNWALQQSIEGFKS